MPAAVPPPAALGPYSPSSKPSPRGPRLILAGSSAPLPPCRESPPTLPASAPTWELPARLPSPRALSPAVTFLRVHMRCLLIPRNSSSSKPLLPASQEAGVASFSLLERNPLATSHLTYLSLNSHLIPNPRSLQGPPMPLCSERLPSPYRLPRSAYSTCFTGYTSTVSPASTLPCKTHNPLFPPLD